MAAEMGAARNLEPEPFTDAELVEAAARLVALNYRCDPLPPFWIPTATAAALLIRTPSCLKRWRVEGKGPMPHYLDGIAVYRLGDVLEFRRDSLHEAAA
jgi:hypothetical protein